MNTKNERQGTKAIRLNNGLSVAIMQKVGELNKVRRGDKKISASDIVGPAFGLLQEKHFEQILASTVTNTNRFEDGWKNYKKQVRHISYDEWLGLIGDGKVKLTDYLSSAPRKQKGVVSKPNKNKLTN